VRVLVGLKFGSEEDVMKTRMAALAIALVAAAPAAWPQAHQPYAGLQARPVKALSDQQIADLKAGRGMGLALAAELNGYPGPMHVLELASPLRLSDDQRAKVVGLFDAMKREAVPLGERLIAAETALDRLFADKTVTGASLSEATRDIASLQGELRLAHLKYHLATLELLTPEQAARYSTLRGYSGGAHTPGHHR
jgi:Spy/CpxP family protein refolding chaperone